MHPTTRLMELSFGRYLVSEAVCAPQLRLQEART